MTDEPTDYQTEDTEAAQLAAPAPSVHDVAAVMKDRLAALEPVAHTMRQDVDEKGRLHQFALRALQVAEEEITRIKTFIEKSRETPRPAGLDVAPIDRAPTTGVPTTKVLDGGMDKPQTPDEADPGLHAPGGTIDPSPENVEHTD